MSNRALACAPCNLAKSSRTVSIDPVTKTNVPLFNPRTDSWADHFGWSPADLAVLEGLTPTGRATIVALNMNGPLQVEARQTWLRVGFLP